MDEIPYDVGQSITLSCLFLTGATVGTILQGQTTLYVRDSSLLATTPGDAILVEGAGHVGGDLRTTVVSADDQTIVLADAAKVNASLVRVGSPANPTSVTCTVRSPDGSNSDVTVTTSLLGLYTGTFTPTTDGTFFYRFQGTGAAAADGWRKFVVRPERVPLS